MFKIWYLTLPIMQQSWWNYLHLLINVYLYSNGQEYQWSDSQAPSPCSSIPTGRDMNETQLYEDNWNKNDKKLCCI